MSRPSKVTGQKYQEVTDAYIQAVHSVLTGETSAPEAAGALEQELGPGFSAELGHAWAAACEWVGRVVLETSHPMAA